MQKAGMAKLALGLEFLLVGGWGNDECTYTLGHCRCRNQAYGGWGRQDVTHAVGRPPWRG